MTGKRSWQEGLVDQLSRFFQEEPSARAFVLTGSLASNDIEADEWSDVDAKVVLVDQAIPRYYPSVAWLESFGGVVGVEHHDGGCTKTLRVCMGELRRLDLTFVAESIFDAPSSLTDNPFSGPYTVVWSRMTDLAAKIAALPHEQPFQGVAHAEILRMADNFWFKASAAIAKVVRNDLLVGLHLALDLARDCLVLQMMRRDQEHGTTIHRTGGYGNEIVQRICQSNQRDSPEEILALVEKCCVLFDELTSELTDAYSARAPLLQSAIDRARSDCRAEAR